MRMQCRRRLLLVTVLVVACQGRRLPTAAILPGLGNLFGNDEKERPPPGRPGQHPRERPPPPPPRVQQGTAQRREPLQSNPQAADEATESDHAVDAKDDDTESITKQQPPPPPPRQQQSLDEQQQPEQMWDPYNPFGGGLPQPPPPGWGAPPPDGMWGTPAPGDWMQQPPMDDFSSMQQEIDDRIAREYELLGQLENLTASLATFEQREDLHVRQLDVLTERVMDAEAAAASERNELLEYRANCTELGRTIAVLQDELDEWKNRCAGLHEQREKDEERVKELQDTLKARDYEVEELASGIETSRLFTEREQYIAERKKKKKRGFFAWLFGIGRDESDDDEQRLQELAKSTLLRALQRERNNVDELEVALSTLQQNNSAISEMVESRDMLINELNDRVAVFEEDKVVLKAALRQLQKEMREEAPKTQKLIHDLQLANEEIHNLNEEIQSLLTTHQDEVVLLQQAIVKKQAAINETESNLTVIGTYVDKLEERLASFAIARRDIDLREKRCKEIEERSLEADRERDAMKKQVDEFAVEHEDLKKLLEEMAQERSALLTEKDDLLRERDRLVDGEGSLRESITSLEQDVAELDSVAREWKSQVIELELQLEEEADRARQAQERYDNLAEQMNPSVASAPESLVNDEEPEETGGSAEAQEEFFDARQAVESEPPEDLVKTETPVVPARPPTLPGSQAPPLPPKDNTGVTRGPPPKEEQGSPPSKGRAESSFRRLLNFLPQGKPTPPSSTHTGAKPSGPPPNRQNIPFRSLRKFASKRTGMHGVFTRSSRQLLERPPPPPAGKPLPSRDPPPKTNRS